MDKGDKTNRKILLVYQYCTVLLFSKVTDFTKEKIKQRLPQLISSPLLLYILIA